MYLGLRLSLWSDGRRVYFCALVYRFAPKVDIRFTKSNYICELDVSTNEQFPIVNMILEPN